MKNEKTKWEITTNRFVAYLDILGFKDRVMRNTHEEIYEDLNCLLDTKEVFLINEQVSMPDDPSVFMATFSDSIIVCSKDDTIFSFDHFLSQLRLLFHGAIRKDRIPLKGCIAHGKISIDKERQIYFGQPIIDAYLLEEEINYMGIICHNSIDKYLNTIKKEDADKWADYFLFKCLTPLKSGKITHYNLNWFQHGQYTLEGKDLEGYYATVSGSARRYIDNTIEMLNEWLRVTNGMYVR